jgi:hypothetical protein
MKPTDRAHESKRDAFDQAVEDIARQAKADGQPPADWTFPKPASGPSVLTPAQRAALEATPPAKAKRTSPKAKPAQAKAPPGPKPGETFYVARLGTDDIYEFEPVDPKNPHGRVLIRHYEGYDLLGRERQYSAGLAEKLYHELVNDKGYTYIDGVRHKFYHEDK